MGEVLAYSTLTSNIPPLLAALSVMPTVFIRPIVSVAHRRGVSARSTLSVLAALTAAPLVALLLLSIVSGSFSEDPSGEIALAAFPGVFAAAVLRFAARSAGLLNPASKIAKEWDFDEMRALKGWMVRRAPQPRWVENDGEVAFVHYPANATDDMGFAVPALCLRAKAGLESLDIVARKAARSWRGANELYLEFEHSADDEIPVGARLWASVRGSELRVVVSLPGVDVGSTGLSTIAACESAAGWFREVARAVFHTAVEQSAALRIASAEDFAGAALGGMSLDEVPKSRKMVLVALVALFVLLIASGGWLISLLEKLFA